MGVPDRSTRRVPGVFSKQSRPALHGTWFRGQVKEHQRLCRAMKKETKEAFKAEAKKVTPAATGEFWWFQCAFRLAASGPRHFIGANGGSH